MECVGFRAVPLASRTDHAGHKFWNGRLSTRVRREIGLDPAELYSSMIARMPRRKPTKAAADAITRINAVVVPLRVDSRRGSQTAEARASGAREPRAHLGDRVAIAPPPATTAGDPHPRTGAWDRRTADPADDANASRQQYVDAANNAEIRCQRCAEDWTQAL